MQPDCAGLLCDILHFVGIVTTRGCWWQNLSVLMVNSDRFFDDLAQLVENSFFI